MATNAKQIKEQLKAQEAAKDQEANEKVAELENDPFVFHPEVIGSKAAQQYREATEFKYLDAVINYDKAVKLRDNLKKDLSEISDDVQRSVRHWLENGRKGHKQPTGKEPEKALQMMNILAAKDLELPTQRNLCEHLYDIILRIQNEVIPAAYKSADDETGAIVAMPTA